MARVASKSAFVAPALMATATPWMISPASAPHMWAATTRSVSPSTKSFISERSVRPDTVCFKGRNVASYTRRFGQRRRASSSVGPTVPMLGWQKTAVGMAS